MAAPNVSVVIVDQSFVASGQENISTTVGSAFSNGKTGNLLTIFGTAVDQARGYMTLNSQAEWVNKYNEVFGSIAGLTASGATAHPTSLYPRGYTGFTLSALQPPDPAVTGITLAGSGALSGTLYNGLYGGLATQWWSVANFLQYGGLMVLSGETGNFNYLVNPIMDKGLFTDIDVAFALENNDAQAAATRAIVGGRDFDCIGIVGASGSFTGYAGVTSGISGICFQSGEISIRESGLGKYGICIYGSKIQLGLDLNSTATVEVPLIADYAGIICRTDRDYGPWWPPAGMSRGRILGGLRLKDQPSTYNQNRLYDAGINYAITMPGQGTFLFGDRTMESTTSTFSRVNVIRLFIYLTNVVGPLARRFLFELNDTTTRSAFVSAVRPILENVQSQRGIIDWQIICDETNNPPAIVDSNQFIADILIKPAKSINFIKIRFTNQNT